MSTKNLKKRSNSETVEGPKSSDQSPPKKQKKQAVVKPVEETTALNGDGKSAPLTAKQRKRLNSKNRKLKAIARVKEEGGIPKPLWPGKKDKKPAVESTESVKTVETKQESKKLTVRQEKRQQDGQYKPEQVTLSADEIRLRISEIQGRAAVTKTAKRKLGVLIKKLAIIDGTAVDNKNVNGDGDASGLSKSGKRRIRREKVGANTGDNDDDGDDSAGDDSGVEKPVDIQSFQKKKKQKTGAVKTVSQDKKIGEKLAVVKTENKINKKDNKAGKQNLGKAAAEIVKQNVEKEENESEEDEDEDEAESEDESEDDEVEEEEGEGDEEEDEDEEEEEEAETPKVEIAPKIVKKEQKQNSKQQSNQEQNSGKTQRYILFVGNLPFDSKVEDVKSHFLTKVGKVSSVRIPTKPGTQTPRGFGYVELTNDIDYEKGLSLHHTMLNGRRINVEYTQSGSKQVSKRQDLVSKNQKLHALRKAGKLAGSQKHDQKRSVRRFKKKEQERTPK